MIAGAGGQVGREMVMSAPAGYQLHALDHRTLGIMDEVAVRLAIRHFQPNIIINALAYTSVDKAESEPELAFAVNQRGVRYLAKAAESEGAALIHISTDYIFSGDKPDSYLETESIDPIEIYDESKFVVVEEIKQY